MSADEVACGNHPVCLGLMFEGETECLNCRRRRARGEDARPGPRCPECRQPCTQRELRDQGGCDRCYASAQWWRA